MKLYYGCIDGRVDIMLTSPEISNRPKPAEVNSDNKAIEKILTPEYLIGRVLFQRRDGCDKITSYRQRDGGRQNGKGACC